MKSGAARGQPLLLACGLSFLLLPAPAWPDVYTWVDERGVQHFVGDAGDIPDRVRDRARLFLVSTPPRMGGTAPGPPEVPLASPEGSPASPAPINQGTIAVSLAEGLGLADLATPAEAAATVLAQRGIVPAGGWVLGGAITPGWLADLARSLLAASSAGLIPHAPGEAFGILEGVAAAVGVALVPIEPPLPPPATDSRGSSPGGNLRVGRRPRLPVPPRPVLPPPAPPETGPDRPRETPRSSATRDLVPAAAGGGGEWTVPPPRERFPPDWSWVPPAREPSVAPAAGTPLIAESRNPVNTTETRRV